MIKVYIVTLNHLFILAPKYKPVFLVKNITFIHYFFQNPLQKEKQ